MKRFRPMSEKLRNAVADECKMLLHAHRDTLRNQGVDTTKLTWKISEGYYCEAFGIMRGLAILNFGYFGPDNLDAVRDGKSTVREHNLKWWFAHLCDIVLQEEGWHEDNQCDWCLDRYGKDAVRSR